MSKRQCGEPSRPRHQLWYRKRKRDNEFTKEKNSDDSDDSDSSGTVLPTGSTPKSEGQEKKSSSEPSPESSISSSSNVSNADHADTLSQPDEVVSSAAESPTNDGAASDHKDDGNSSTSNGGNDHAENDGCHDGDTENDEETENSHESDDNILENVNGPEVVPQAVAPEAQLGIAVDNEPGSDDSDSEPSESDAGESSSDSSESSGDDAENEDNEDIRHENDPLYEGARITLGESLMAILCFVMSHRLTGQCVNDLLDLISIHCGQNNICIKSLYRFKKYFKIIGNNLIVKHFFCSNCELPLATENSVCTNCNGQYDIAYFIEFPIVKQLQSMYSRPGFYESLFFKLNRQKKVEGNIEDIYDGEIYKELVESGFLADPNNISFLMYFDGVSLFKSSSYSIWPVYLSINELQYTQRTKRHNTVLAGIWFGKSKPNPNLLMQPLQESLSTLESDGVDLNLPNGDNISVRARVIGAVADMPAKALFMRFIQFNGGYSCFKCMAQGERFGIGNNNSVQVFPYCNNIIDRDNDETSIFAEQARLARENDPNATVYGVKGPSLLSVILPNLISCMAIDIMHGIFLGVMRTLMTLWFDGQHSLSPFSISALVHIVDNRLKSIKPPMSFKVPRGIKKEFSLMKAVDFKNFFFFFSLPVLNGILPVNFWQHHCKLVVAISLLCQDSISLEQVNVAQELLHVYVQDFQHLYGLRHLSLTFHQLLHLPVMVRKLGNAWVYSCFFYESLNGELARLVHGSRHAALQICSASSVFMNLSVRVHAMPDSVSKDLCLKFMGRTKLQVKVTENIDPQSCVVGIMKIVNPSPNIRMLMQTTFQIFGGRYKTFFRLKIKGTVYTSEAYVRSNQKLSCYVNIVDGGTPYLCKLKSFLRWSPCVDCPFGCNNCPKLYACVVTVYDRIPWEAHNVPLNTALPHLNRVVQTPGIRAFSVSCIKSVCLYMSIDNKEYIGQPVNSVEIE